MPRRSKLVEKMLSSSTGARVRMRRNPEGVNFEQLHELYLALEVEIRGAMARALWVAAWMKFVQEVEEAMGDDYDDRYDEWTARNGDDWMDLSPDTPTAAYDAAVSLERAIAKSMKLGFADVLEEGPQGANADDIEILRNIGDMEDEQNWKAVDTLLEQLPYPLAVLYVRAMFADRDKQYRRTNDPQHQNQRPRYALADKELPWRGLPSPDADSFGADLGFMAADMGSWFDDHAEFELKVPRGEIHLMQVADTGDDNGLLSWHFTNTEKGEGHVDLPDVENPEAQPPAGPYFHIEDTDDDDVTYVAYVEIDGLPQYAEYTGWAAEGAMAMIDTADVLGADLPGNYFQMVDSTRWNRETQTMYRGVIAARYELRNQYQNEMMTRMLASTYDLAMWRMGDLVWANQNDWNYGNNRWVIGVRGSLGMESERLVVFTNGYDLQQAIDIAADWVLENSPQRVQDESMREMRNELIREKCAERGISEEDQEELSDKDWSEIDEAVDEEYETFGNYSTAFRRGTFFVIAHNPNVQQLMELAQ